MKNLALFFIALFAVTVLGCGSEQAPGYDSASRDAAEALAKNGNDITKLTPEQRSALEGAARKDGNHPTGMSSTNGGEGSAPASGQ